MRLPLFAAFFLIFLLILPLSVGLSGCEKSGNKTRSLLYSYDFEDGNLGPEWKNEGGQWEIRNGRMTSKSARNKDLVLTKPLPAEAEIELEMISHSPQVDVKFRAWGDSSADLHDGAYHFILGGWNNRISTIAPLGEHDKRRVEKRQALEKDRWYKVRVVRRDGFVTLFLDGKEFMRYADKDPLDPKVYKYFSFANWLTDCEFDNLKIYEYK